MRLGSYQFDNGSISNDIKDAKKFNIFTIISKIFKELYDDSKEVIKAILN